MENDTKAFLADLLEQLKSIDYIKPVDIPNIDLYMDQITTFMDEQLAASKRYESDKILTKTMINNYAKNNLLPPPSKKKYSKEHVLTLLFIYYFKNILSINDIHSILNPLTEKYFGNTDGFSMVDIYNEVFGLEAEESKKLMKDLGKKFNLAKDTSIPDVILKATKSSVFRINEKLHNGKQGFALTKKASHHDHRRNAKPHHSLLYSCHKIQRDPPIPLFLIRFQQPPL